MVPRRAEESEKAIPNRKSNEEPHQDEHMTALDPPKAANAHFSPTPRGSFWHPKTTQNGARKDQQSKRKIKKRKERSETISNPSWGDLRSFWDPMWRPKTPTSIVKHTIS